ncbi:Protein glycosylation K [Lactobacillus helveticus]|nr:Protein glycosylation K [Lactobacillus helveticus]
MFVAALVALITVHWSLFVASVILDIFAYYVPKLVQKKMERATDNLSKQNKMYLNTLSQWFSGLAEIRRYFAGIKLFKVQEQAADKVEQAHVKQTAAQQEMIILNGVCNIVMQIILMAMTASLITKGLITFGAIMSVQNFAANISIGLRQMLQAISYMKSSHNLMNNISADTFEINVEKKHTTAAPATIATHDLALDFPNGESLRFPDLEINQGEKILLTGDSGAGKSTLFKLILGSIKPSKGKVEFKDKKGNVVNPDMTKIGYIPQDPNLFPGTIKDNITMFNNRLDQRVTQVIDEVNFATDIAKFKNGVNEKLNLDNLNISGGQRQKIVLARAKIHDADIILIDEGTSAIDQKATMNILQKLVKEKATIVFIAHNFNEGMRQLFDREIHLVKE